MQRDVDVEIDSLDKSGGFIGALYLNKTENAAITLLKHGLASVHSFSADSLPWAKQLYDAEVSLFPEASILIVLNLEPVYRNRQNVIRSVYVRNFASYVCLLIRFYSCGKISTRKLKKQRLQRRAKQGPQTR